MNLAIKDIRHNLGRFILTTLGIGLLLMVVMGMAGIYRGLVEDATLLVNRIGADLWVVQKNTRGPFAEVSRVPASMEDRVRAVPGVAEARAFISHTIQRERNGQPLRLTLQGLSWPEDRGEWLPLAAGRPLGQAHYEMIADQTLGLGLGEKLRLGKDEYEVVGLTRGMVSTGGDGMAFFTLRDARAIQYDVPPEATRLEREARHAQASADEIGHTRPQLIERSYLPSERLPALNQPAVSAVTVRVEGGTDPQAVASVIGAWPDVTVHTQEGERELLLRGMVDRARRQLGLFRVLLVVISAIIMALILYTLTLDKLHEIALLKLMGARNGVILGLILQQALLLGALGYAVAWWLGGYVFPNFPRRVIIVEQDLWALALIVAGISVVSSLLGIWRAMRVRAAEVVG